MPEPTIQGAVLVQSWLRLPPPHHLDVLDGLRRLPVARLIDFCCSKTASHVFDAALRPESTVGPRERRRLIQSLLGHLHILAMDRIGSRVCDACWDAADSFLKAKMAGSLVPHNVELHGSEYGRFFAKKLQLPLYESAPHVWTKKVAQAARKQPTADETVPVNRPRIKPAVRAVPDPDEVDAIFSAAAS